MTDVFREDGRERPDVVERLHTIRDHLRTGRFGQREVWEEWLTEAADDIARLTAALQEIEQWAQAYPLSIFPKPDLKRAHELLQAGGITLDAISADAMRHVVEGIADIARRALEPKP